MSNSNELDKRTLSLKRNIDAPVEIVWEEVKKVPKGVLELDENVFRVYFDDKKGHVLVKNQPLAICDKTAGDFAKLGRDDIYISESTYHYDGGGCC